MKQQLKSVKFNMVMNAILTMSNIIFPLITFPYVSRILMPDGMGKISFATSIVAYFSMLAQLGIPTYGIRTCARIRDDRNKLSATVCELLLLNAVTLVIAYTAFIVCLCAIPRLRAERNLLVIMSVTIVLNAIGVEWLYKALEQYAYITIRSLVFKIIALAAMFLLIHRPEDYVVYGGISIFAASASNVMNFVNLGRLISFKKNGEKYNLKKHIKPMLVFFWVSVAATIYTNLDNVMLGFMNTDTEVGYYSGAVKVKTILIGLVTSASVVLLPRVSNYLEKGKREEFNQVLNKTMRLIIIMAVPLTIYFIFFAKESITFLSGKEFEGAIVPMMIIMPTLLFIGMTNLIGIQMMVPLGREKQVFRSEVWGAVIDFVINLFLIPGYGAAGAAIGTVVAELAVLIVQLIYTGKDVKVIFSDMPWVKIIAACVVAGAVAVPVKLADWNSVITLMVSGCLFFGIYGISLIIQRESLTIETIKGIVKR